MAVVAGLVAGYVMAIAGLWAGQVPGPVAIDISDYGRRYMVSDRPSAWLLGFASHLANSVLLVLLWACTIEPNLDWPRPLEGLLWGEVLALTLAGAFVAPLREATPRVLQRRRFVLAISAAERRSVRR